MSTLLDEETVVLDALDFDIPCAVGGHKAEISVECKQCPAQRYMCRQHWEDNAELITNYLAQHKSGRVYCGDCKAEAFSLDSLVRVVSL